MNPHSTQRLGATDRHSHRRQERDGRRQRILNAAEAAFSAEGFHDASLAGIAREADLAVGTLYLYFADKADLYGQVVLEKMKRIAGRFDEALAAEGSAGLRQAAHAHFDFHDANRPFFEIFLHQHQVQSSPLHTGHWDELEKLKRRILDRITACIERGQELGELKPGNPRLYALAFLGVILQITRQAIRGDGGVRLADSADFAVDCFLHGACRP